MPVALTIAGSDSGGGAGIQADLKTFAAFGVYGTTAITAITAQNTTGVTAVHVVPTDIVIAQIEAIVADIAVDAVKTGMLATTAIVEAVAAAIEGLELPRVVVDPVMLAKSGDRLLDEDAIVAMKSELLPRCSCVTPNVPEAAALAGIEVASVADMREAARRIAALGPAAVIVKGGHLPGAEVADVVFDGHGFTTLTGPRVVSRHTHGTGCSFASAVAAGLARGRGLVDAAREARDFVAGGIRHAPAIGHGHGPLDHFWRGTARLGTPPPGVAL